MSANAVSMLRTAERGMLKTTSSSSKSAVATGDIVSQLAMRHTSQGREIESVGHGESNDGENCKEFVY
jgi:hypothetical protein